MESYKSVVADEIRQSIFRFEACAYFASSRPDWKPAVNATLKIERCSADISLFGPFPDNCADVARAFGQDPLRQRTPSQLEQLLRVRLCPSSSYASSI